MSLGGATTRTERFCSVCVLCSVMADLKLREQLNCVVVTDGDSDSYWACMPRLVSGLLGDSCCKCDWETLILIPHCWRHAKLCCRICWIIGSVYPNTETNVLSLYSVFQLERFHSFQKLFAYQNNILKDVDIQNLKNTNIIRHSIKLFR